MKINGVSTTNISRINNTLITSISSLSGVVLPTTTTTTTAPPTTTTTTTSTSYTTPLVSSGLILELDAALSISYPGSGTSWYDLSGNGNHCTLYNSPAFDSVGGGSIVFDGADDYGYTPVTIEAAVNSNLQTFCSWMYGTDGNKHWFGSDANGWGQHHLIVSIDPYWGSGPSPNLVYGASYYGGGGGESNAETDVSAFINTGGWNYVCVVKTAAETYDVWLNNNPVFSNVNRNSLYSTHLQFGTFWSGFAQPSQLSMVHVYNRALDSSEINANYNVGKTRYGL